MSQADNWTGANLDRPVALPAGRLLVDALSFKNCPTAVNDDLEGIGSLRLLRSLNLSGTQVNGDAIENLRQTRGLIELALGYCGLKTSDLERLPDWPDLQVLWLNTKMINDDWKSLRRFPNLRWLNITLDGLLPDLTPLGDLANLRRLNIRGLVEVDPQTIVTLQRRNPNLHITAIAGSTLEAGKTLGTDPARDAARKLLKLGISVSRNEVPSSTNGSPRRWPSSTT